MTNEMVSEDLEKNNYLPKILLQPESDCLALSQLGFKPGFGTHSFAVRKIGSVILMMLLDLLMPTIVSFWIGCPSWVLEVLFCNGSFLT